MPPENNDPGYAAVDIPMSLVIFCLFDNDFCHVRYSTSSKAVISSQTRHLLGVKLAEVYRARQALPLKRIMVLKQNIGGQYNSEVQV